MRRGAIVSPEGVTRRRGERSVGRLAALFVTLAAVALLAGCDSGDTLIIRDGDERYGCLTFAHVGFGPVRETWECFDPFDHNRTTPLVTLTRLGGVSEGYGEVYVAGEVHPAAFEIRGLNWRWDFGCNEREATYPDAFVLAPDGVGLYYDFRPSDDGTAEPRDRYACLMAP